jgi:hypothetical protein
LSSLPWKAPSSPRSLPYIFIYNYIYLNKLHIQITEGFWGFFATRDLGGQVPNDKSASVSAVEGRGTLIGRKVRTDAVNEVGAGV